MALCLFRGTIYTLFKHDRLFSWTKNIILTLGDHPRLYKPSNWSQYCNSSKGLVIRCYVCSLLFSLLPYNISESSRGSPSPLIPLSAFPALSLMNRCSRFRAFHQHLRNNYWLYGSSIPQDALRGLYGIPETISHSLCVSTDNIGILSLFVHIRLFGQQFKSRSTRVNLYRQHSFAVQ